ncbi:MAG TPA: hypothetical protein DEO37_03230 [Aerococcaceae bacterium]|nr:hypothetical protein [Aerococcaceae bacterium]
MKWKGLHFEKQSIFISMLYLQLSFIIMGLGINLVAHANLSTSALTLIPLVLNELDPLSFGELTMIFNIILVISQVILLGKSFPLLQYFQINVSFVLRVSVDFWRPKIQNFELKHFLWQLIAVVIGCFTIVLIIMIQLKADFVNNPGEGIVKAIALRFNTELFSKIKVPLDRKIEQTARGIGATLDVEGVVTYDYKYPPVTNDAQVTTEVVNSLEEILSGHLVEVEEPLMGGEDYAYYLYEAPGTFLFLSNPSNIKGQFHVHQPVKFDVNESLFYMATAAFVKVALDYLN